MPRKAVYKQDPEKYREYNRTYLKKWRAANPDKQPHTAEYSANYRKRPIPRFKTSVRIKVYQAIKLGKLQRQNCETENCSVLGEAHHDDYNKPLDVRWLCKTHHELFHHPISERNK